MPRRIVKPILFPAFAPSCCLFSYCYRHHLIGVMVFLGLPCFFTVMPAASKPTGICGGSWRWRHSVESRQHRLPCKVSTGTLSCLTTSWTAFLPLVTNTWPLSAAPRWNKKVVCHKAHSSSGCVQPAQFMRSSAASSVRRRGLESRRELSSLNFQHEPALPHHILIPEEGAEEFFTHNLLTINVENICCSSLRPSGNYYTACSVVPCFYVISSLLLIQLNSVLSFLFFF